MNPFLVAIDLNGATLGLDALNPALPALSQSDGRVDVLWSGSWAGAWVPSRTFARPAFLHQHGIYAVGNVRLTGRTNRRTDLDRAVDDLAHIVDEYRRVGPLAVRGLQGDFAFALWDSNRRQLLAARDSFGVKTLFWKHQGSRLYVGSHLDCFEASGYDRAFVGDFLVGLPVATTRTIYADVNRLAAGSVLVSDDQGIATRAYWSPTEFIGVDRAIEPEEAALEWRRLFFEAVHAQLDDGAPAWAQLSGGLDSSSVVAVAAGLAKEGKVAPLLGTLSVVDGLSDGDETRYSDAVIAAYPHRNEKLADYWAWQPDQLGPPTLGEPRIFLPFYARSRAMNDIVIGGGGRVMLSGFGSDQYLAGPHSFVADWVRQGRLGAAARQLTDLAVARRTSFYREAFNNVIKPLAPRWLSRRWTDRSDAIPEWINPELAAEFNLADRAALLDAPEYDRGCFADRQIAELGTIDLALERGISEQGTEMRYPFLHRPLVEFSLSLPPNLRIQPNRKKWILRKALHDVLPPLVRDRFGKGGIDGRIVWSLTHERALLDQLTAASQLAELGFIDKKAFATALEAARTGNVWSGSMVMITLALETWLAARSGRWSGIVSVASAANTAANPSTQGVNHVELH